MPGQRVSSTEIETRINQIYEMLVAGASPQSIWQFLTQKEDSAKDNAWDNVSTRQFARYIAEARTRLQEAAKIHHREELGRAIERLHRLYFASVQIRDYKAALAVQKELNTLLKLDQIAAPPADNGEDQTDAAAVVRLIIEKHASAAGIKIETTSALSAPAPDEDPDDALAQEDAEEELAPR